MSNKIIKRIYVRGILTLLSPLLLGSGGDENSDIDLLRDWEGRPFIPGSALAGVLRHYLGEILHSKDIDIVEEMFGRKPQKEQDSTQSLIYFYDAEIKNQPQIQIRDGVEIDNLTKTAKEKGKYGYEVLEAGNAFEFRTELIIREKHNASLKKIENLLYLILNTLQNEKIRIGGKTRRGFGKVKLEDIRLLVLNMNKPEDRNKWIDFNWDFEGNSDIGVLNHNELGIKDIPITTIKVKFSIPYSLIIKHYSSEPEVEDMEHLFSAGNSVIPGTSWTGALRHAMENIGREIEREKEIKDLIEKLFGYVDEESKKAKASRIYIEESVIRNEVSVSYTRSKVDRFTGGVVEGALFEERPVFNNDDTEVHLNIDIKEGEDAEIGLLLLAIRDLWYGIQTIGGEANIGRGVLEGKELIVNSTKINLENNEDEKYLNALAEYLWS